MPQMSFGVNSVTNLDQPVGRAEPKDRISERAAAQRSEEDLRGEEERARIRDQEAQREERARTEFPRKVDFFA